MAATKLLFNELNAPDKAPKSVIRDPWGRFDTRERREAYERKMERLRGTIRYLLSVNAGTATTIRRLTIENKELKRKLQNNK